MMNKANTNTERLFVLSKEFNIKIIDVQIYENEHNNDGIVLFFSPRFLWFKKRTRCSLKMFNAILNNRELTNDEIRICKNIDFLKETQC